MAKLVFYVVYSNDFNLVQVLVNLTTNGDHVLGSLQVSIVYERSLVDFNLDAINLNSIFGFNKDEDY